MLNLLLFLLLRRMSRFLLSGTRLIAEGPAVFESFGTEVTARTGELMGVRG